MHQQSHDLPNAGAGLARRSYTAADLNQGRGPLDALRSAAWPVSAALLIATGLTFIMVQLGR